MFNFYIIAVFTSANNYFECQCNIVIMKVVKVFVLWNEKCSVMFWKILYDLRTALNIQSNNLHYYEYTVCLGRGNRVTKYPKMGWIISHCICVLGFFLMLNGGKQQHIWISTYCIFLSWKK